MDALKLQSLPHYTYEDYKVWKGEWELIYGVPHAMAPSPVKRHQKLIGLIFSQLDEALGEYAECEVLLEEDWKVRSDLVLRPDVAVVCHDMETRFIAKTPAVVFEVLSPATAERDENLKFGIYEKEGVAYYVLVYPDELMARIYRNEKGFVKVGEFEKERVMLRWEGCEAGFDFGALFGRFR